MELKFELKDNALTILLPDNVDTTNAVEVEDSISKVIEANQGFEKLVLDASNLQYISSVGLRIVLRLKQNFENFSVVEAAANIYEIFQMTGFTDIIDIQKGLRRISVEGCKVIGEGFYGRVYRISPDTIVKVYFRGGDISDVNRERNLAKTAFVLGIPTAISYDIVKVNEEGKECYGSVFELLEATSLRDLVRDNPKQLDEYIKMHTELVKRINSTMVLSKDIPYAKEATKEWLKTVEPLLEKPIFDKLRALIATIPDIDYMIHGDCHVKNILVQNGEPLLIDMDTLSKGHQIFDVMAFYLSYIAYELTEPGNTKMFLDLDSKTCIALYEGIFQGLYGDRSKQEQEDIQKKVETLGFLLLLYRTVLYSPNDEKRRNLCIERVSRYVPELNTLEY